MSFSEVYRLLFLCFLTHYVNAAICPVPTCPNGGTIYSKGIKPADAATVIAIHNKYRKMVLNGQVPGQPAAEKMAMLQYDRNLGALARNVTKTCKMKHVRVHDKRWFGVGQNLFIERSSKKNHGANWEKAITKWFNENKFYQYPNNPNKFNGHYTQVVTAASTHVGCDYIFFYDNRTPKFPYTKLYACNYGPAGNIIGIPIYKKAKFP